MPALAQSASCPETILEAMRAQGAEPVAPSHVAFLLEGQTRSPIVNFPEAGCFALLALGAGLAQDVDLRVHTASGTFLGEDVTAGPQAFVRFCGAAGLSVALSARMTKGRGEVRIVALRGGPESLAALGPAVAACLPGQPGLHHAFPRVQRAPARGSWDQIAASLERQLRALGYALQQDAGELGAQADVEVQVLVEGGRCYVAAAYGREGVIDLDLVVLSPDGRPVGRDVSAARDASAPFCATSGGSYRLRIRRQRGEGTISARLYRFDPRSSFDALRARAPAELGMEGLSPYLELGARARARGFALSPLGWGYVRGVETVGMPVRLEAGRCYAFGAAPASESAGGDLDLVLEDESGDVAAWDLRRDSRPLVFHCPASRGTFRLEARLRGAVGRVLFLQGVDDGGAP